MGKKVWVPGALTPPIPLPKIPLPTPAERILVTKGKWGCVHFGWMWLVRDEAGQAIGCGFLEDVEERTVRTHAAVCWVLNFTEPLPPGYEGLVPE